jgi:hypothetical protein
MNRVAEQTSYRANIGVVHGWNLHDLRRELFLSTDIFTRKNNRWWPVNVLDKSADFGPVSAQVKEVPIEWSYAFSNTQYTPESADLGEVLGFAFTTACAFVTYAINGTTIGISFTHAPSPVDQYQLILLDSDGDQVGATVLKTIPYTAPITHTFTGLTEETEYKARIVMKNLETGESRTCTYSPVTTLEEDGDDPFVPTSYEFAIRLGNTIAGLCSQSPTTLYCATPILDTGSLLFTNAGLSTPLSGYAYIIIPLGMVYNLIGNEVGGPTGDLC